jgi:hypothetical protein
MVTQIYPGHYSSGRVAICKGSSTKARAIPTFNIVSVVKDVSVTIQTSTFPATNCLLCAWKRKHEWIRGSGGCHNKNNSGAGGAFQETY